MIKSFKKFDLSNKYSSEAMKVNQDLFTVSKTSTISHAKATESNLANALNRMIHPM